MGCIKSLVLKSVALCKRPQHLSLDELVITPRHRTPMDRFGFPQRCCFCCPLRAASVLICFVSLMWGAMEMNCADKTVDGAVTGSDTAVSTCKLVYMVFCLLFILACGSLLLGIIIKKEIPILVFVWFGFIFNCVMILVLVGSALAGLVRAGGLARRQTARLVFGIVWSIIFFYLLMVVNSYMLYVWYLSLGFGI